MKKLLYICLFIAVVAIGIFIYRDKIFPKPLVVVEVPVVVLTVSEKVIGKSVEGRNITAFSYGTGEKEILFVGGIHGGYEWNTVMLAYELMDYFKENPDQIPKNITFTVMPTLNPDGLYKITGKDGRFNLTDVGMAKVLGEGRFNANNVDLNRNFDCSWKPEAKWRDKIVSAGTSAFSEPETLAFKNLVLKKKPVAVVFAHSASNGVFGSSCGGQISSETRALMSTYSKASLYPVNDTFSAYPVTGDASDWLSTVGVPAISVELATHESIEFDKNLAGAKALMEIFEE